MAVTDDDRLDVEPGVFQVSATLEYHAEVARILLADSLRLLQLVILPSFEPESAVYVTKTGARCQGAAGGGLIVTTGRPRQQLWATAMEPAAEAEPGRPRVFRAPTAAHFASLSPAVDWARAPISEDAFRHILAVWDAALIAARPRERASIILDGTSYHFATPTRSGLARSPDPSSIPGELAKIGVQLSELPRIVAKDDRSARERALVSAADRLLARASASAS